MPLRFQSFLFLTLLPHQTHSYASWMVDRSVACWTDLEPGSVVMNNEILSHEKSLHPSVRVMALKNDVEIDQIEGYIPYKPGDKIVLKFDTPSELNDPQFVLQLDPESSDGAIFSTSSGGPVGCEGKRTACRKKTDFASLSLDGTDDMVKVWAGWATGHEAVTLTPELVFRKEGEWMTTADVVADAEKDSAGEAEPVIDPKTLAMKKMEEMKMEARMAHDLDEVRRQQIGVVAPSSQKSDENEKDVNHRRHRKTAVNKPSSHSSSHSETLRKRHNKGSHHKHSKSSSSSFVTPEVIFGCIFLGVFMLVIISKNMKKKEKGKYSL